MSAMEEKKKKKKKKKPKASSLLSFGDEEEDVSFGKVDLSAAKKDRKASKNKSKSKAKKAKLKAHPSTRTRTFQDHGRVNTQVSTAGMYSKENLEALKRNSLFLTGNSSAYRGREPLPDVQQYVPGSDDDEPGIPSVYQIKAAKEKRERLRKQGEYIALQMKTGGLEGTRGTPEREAGSGNRLLREDIAHDMDGVFADEAGARIQFGDVGKEGSRMPSKRERQEMGIADMEVAGDDSLLEGPDAPELIGNGRKITPKTINRTSIDGGGDISFDLVHSRLQAAAKTLASAHRRNEKQLKKVQDRRKSGEESQASLRREYASQGKQYKFYQEMKQFVLELADCLDEKIPLVEEAEDRFKDLMTGRMARIRANAAARLKEEEADLMMFGGNRGHSEEGARAVRKAERRRRRDQRADRRRQSGLKHPEGWSTDEDDDEDKATQKAHVYEVVHKTATILADTIPEYSDINIVKEKFNRWKTEFTTSYRDAFISLSVRAVFVPFIRLDLVAWDPLTVPCFDDMPWFQSLFDYGGDDMADDDPDLKLVPDLVQNVILPVAEYHLRHAMDACSGRAHTGAKELLEAMGEFFDTAPPEMVALSTAVTATLTEAVGSLRIPLIPPRSRDAMTALAMSQRQFFRALKLFVNIGSWEDVDAFADKAELRPLAEKILNNRMVPYLQSVMNTDLAIASCEAIAKYYPSPWLPKHEEAPACSLAPFVDYLTGDLLPLLQRQADPGDSIARLAKVLKKIGARDAASAALSRAAG